MPTTIEADYIIVGAGSAGCVLANRLSANGRNEVLLLEAGGDDRPTRAPDQFFSNLMVHTPAGYALTLSDPKVNWLYETEADPGTGGRTHVWPRGKVLGGSSSINGLLYIRGQKEDYDGWRQLGCTGWGSDDVLPYFMRAQHQERGANEHSGVGGPLNVSDARDGHVVSDAVVEACVQAGLPHVEDVNGPEQEGVSWLQLTVKNGQRCSAAVAYLHPALNRENLRVEKHALAQRVTFEGKRATGVEFVQNDRVFIAKARKEVILSGGAVNSPQLLQLSGIGPSELLRSHGIEIVHASPGVGGNLQDHYIFTPTYRLKPGSPSINMKMHGPAFLAELAKYAIQRRGILTLSPAHVTIFCRSREELASPDIQFHVLPATPDMDQLVGKQKFVLDTKPGLTMAPCQLRPESRGTINIRSANPSQYPSIVPNYLADTIDQECAIAGLKWARKIAQQPALQAYIESELTPGVDVRDDAAMLEYARMSGTTLYHPVGTCAMGMGANAVVDPELRVIGVSGLRVVDASVMPRLVSGNTNAPTIMIAEKASDMILADSKATVAA